MVRRKARKPSRLERGEVTIAVAKTAAEVGRCYEVMRELRSDLRTRKEFVERVQRQQEEGFRLAYLASDAQVQSVAGYRILRDRNTATTERRPPTDA